MPASIFPDMKRDLQYEKPRMIPLSEGTGYKSTVMSTFKEILAILKKMQFGKGLIIINRRWFTVDDQHITSLTLYFCPTWT